MSNTVAENQSTTENSKQQSNSNDGYSQRQLQSSFEPSTVTFVIVFFFR